MSDPLALLLAFVYVSLILGVGEGLRRAFGLSVDFTRKFIHVGVGMIAFALVALFKTWQFAVIPPLVFILINYISYRRRIFSGMETGKRGQLGTIYFPISFSILIPLMWPTPALLVASLMPMTWGDSFAAIVGTRWGTHKYAIFGQTRSLEGSSTMFLLSLVTTWLTLLFLAPTTAAPLLALSTAVAATVIEALSPWGTDNLTVPLTSALVLVAITRAVGN